MSGATTVSVHSFRADSAVLEDESMISAGLGTAMVLTRLDRWPHQGVAKITRPG